MTLLRWPGFPGRTDGLIHRNSTEARGKQGRQKRKKKKKRQQKGKKKKKEIEEMHQERKRRPQRNKRQRKQYEEGRGEKGGRENNGIVVLDIGELRGEREERAKEGVTRGDGTGCNEACDEELEGVTRHRRGVTRHRRDNGGV